MRQRFRFCPLELASYLLQERPLLFRRIGGGAAVPGSALLFICWRRRVETNNVDRWLEGIVVLVLFISSACFFLEGMRTSDDLDALDASPQL